MKHLIYAECRLGKHHTVRQIEPTMAETLSAAEHRRRTLRRLLRLWAHRMDSLSFQLTGEKDELYQVLNITESMFHIIKELTQDDWRNT